jgi:hypothetical protein
LENDIDTKYNQAMTNSTPTFGVMAEQAQLEAELEVILSEPVTD